MAHSYPGSFGAFHVRAALGAGRCGPVYRAEAAETGEPVIVRTLEATLEPAQRDALLEALEWVCETPLDHPAIGRPLACGIEGDTPFLVHAFVPGTPLAEFLERRGPQPVDEAIVRLTQLAGAVDFAAAAGVHHGALDRRDVFLSAHHTAISGFGLAQAATQAGVRLDTSGAYASPQQRAGGPPTHADDVHALGVLALQLLCGRADDDDRPEDLLQLLQDTGLSPALRAVFDAALAADPAARPPTALRLAAALQDAVAPGAGPDAHEPAHAAGGDGRFTDVPLAPHGTEAPGRLVLHDGEDGAPDLPLLSDAAFSAGEPASRMDAETEGASARHARGRRGSRRPGRAQLGASAAAAGESPRAPEPGTGDAGFDTLRDSDAAPAQLPLALSLTGAGGAGEDGDDGDLMRGGSDARGATVPPGAVSRGSDLFVPVDRASGSRPWLLVGVVLAMLLVAGIAGAFLIGGSTETVPFPRSAAPVGGSPAGESGAAVDEPPGAAGPVRIPDTPVVPDPAPDGGDVGVRGRPLDPPELIVEPIDEPPPPAAPPAERVPETPRAAAPPTSPGAGAPAPAVPRRPEPPPGRILVRSTPAGAQVAVNGEPRGDTPLAVRELPLGAHTIVVSHPAYGTRQERVTLTDAVPARSIDFELDRPATPGAAAASAGALQVESRPAGARVFLDDRLVGTTPLVLPDVAAGAHVVRLELPGYRRWTTSVTVGSGARARVAASLEP